MTPDAILAPYRALWALVVDGDAFETPSSYLQPVRQDGRPAMLKLIKTADEENGPAALAYFAGEGATALLVNQGWAQVTERANGGRDLIELARANDDGAFAPICDVLELLHAPRPAPAPVGLISLRRRFKSLFKARSRSSVFEQPARIAEALLAAPRDERVLHGDMHHGNVVWDAARGWLAIDPKGVFGERAYDYANAMLNPVSAPDLVLAPGRLARQTEIVSARIGVSRRRVLEFAAAYAGLSAAWTLEESGAMDLSVLEMALEALAGSPIR